MRQRFASVHGAVGLVVAVHVDAPHGHPPVDRLLPDPRRHRAVADVDVANAADVHRQYAPAFHQAPNPIIARSS
jgi:hypothetical protein